MSRLATRLVRLEQKLGHCPTCKDHPCRVELLTHSGERLPERTSPKSCPDCGRAVEVIIVRVAFDLSPERPERSAPETAPGERERETA